MVLCIDIGGTAIKYGLVNESEGGLRWLSRKEMPTNAKILKGAGIRSTVLDIAQKASQSNSLRGIAISTAGMVDSQTGAIIYANENIPEYGGINLKTAVEGALNLPCWVENDVNAAALGEYAYGAGRGSESMLCITVGTGIGGAVVLNGAVHAGFSRSAGEIGYMIIEGEMFEKIASASALVEGLRQKTGIASLDGKLVFEEAKKGNALYVQEIASMCERLAQGIHNCACLLNPEIIVLGGGIMAQRDYLAPIIKSALKKYMSPHVYGHTKLDFATLGNDAGMAGAFYFWKSKEMG